ncbi:putative mediator complex subunit 20 [Cavenderia fasciculata]|uniref:Mediator of RNA polymerase II transcription subunit 20 n=1 Tax=Cavenderia fasciculata TaxID=261658 RepID=F4PM69_CACFS|nr:putative mediator complex subunit 20 [Cavenderia fasciculata]EGG23569.1 putative mediator complex subunit 20 [Cavenderia fasciculata]|eukprot:XP_004361420.1 putative mediator complex subunit 20 [Cavenderia fasciculata]
MYVHAYGTIPEITKRIEFLGGIKVSSNWMISCALYLERIPEGTQVQAREFYLLSFDEEQKKSYIVTQNNVSEVDRDIVSILEKTNSYKKRQVTEVYGVKYEIGDFTVKFGPITLRAETRGILVEVEYCASLVTTASPFNSSKLLSEFINNNLLNNLSSSNTPTLMSPTMAQGVGVSPQQQQQQQTEQIQTSYDFSQYQVLTSKYSDAHTSCQYVNFFKNILKQ